MVGEIYNNGNPYKFRDDYIGGGNHSMVWFKDIKEVSFYMDQGNFLTNLLGPTKGKLTIRYKQFIYSTDLITLTIEVKKSEFDMVQLLVAEIKKAIIAEEERQRKINEAIQKKLQEQKKAAEHFDAILTSIPPVTFMLSDEKVLRNKAILTPFEESANITKRTPSKKYKNFIVVDTETTGIKTGGNDIIEVTAIKFEDCIPTSIFTTLLKPRKPIPADATKINGITDNMVESAPVFSQIKTALQEYIGEYPIVAHNAAFDIEFLHVSGLEFIENPTIYDTLALSRKHIKDSCGDKLDNYKLSTVCAECGIYFDGAHRSSADALATGFLFIEIIKRIKDAQSIEEIL